MNNFEKTAFYPADILIPKNVDMSKWSVVACDQFTSQPDYWNDVKNIVGANPSTYNIVFPEIYLNDADKEARIDNINKTMIKYYQDNLFDIYKNCFIYVERKLPNGKVRKGIVGVVDLEEYKFEPGNTAKIRATEGTVLERIPPRVKIRENALLELPHIMLLIDDFENIVFSAIDNSKENLIYDIKLMKNGGSIKGYKCNNTDEIAEKLNELQENNFDENNTMLFAIGDGNHSLATAKACWENIKKSGCSLQNNPARYALVEIENIHDKALEFEPINRIIFNCDANDLLDNFKKYCNATEEVNENAQQLTAVINCKEVKLYIENPTSNLAVGTLQTFLDKYILENNCEIDYIHGDDVVMDLSKRENSIGFLLPSMEKSDLFKTIIKDGILPRKTFSMGEANEKRYYVECRKIK